MNLTIDIIHLSQVLACNTPNPLQWSIILSIVGGILVISGVGATGIAAVASTVVTMLVAGASIDAIVTAVAGLLNTLMAIGASLEVVAQLVYAIKVILGC